MRKILFVANFSNTTGYAWNNIYRLFDHLAGELKQHEVECFASFATIVKPVTLRNFDKHYIEFDPHNSTADSMIKLLSFVREKRIEGVYFTDQPPLRVLYALLRCAGVKKVIIHSRTSVPDPKPAQPETGIKWLLKTISHRIPFINADRVYAVSDFVRDRIVLKACFPGERVIKVLNGIDTELFKPALPLKDRSPVKVFICGRATPHKGIDTLIRALGKLDKRIAIRVDYYGDGPCIERYRALVKSLDLVHVFSFKGAVPSTQPFLHDYDIACVPSAWGDACPSSVSEALASGIPLVASRAGGIPELVGGHENAVLVEPKDSSGLARAIERLASSYELRREYSNNGRKRAEELLSLETYYRTMLSRFLIDFEPVAAPIAPGKAVSRPGSH